MQLVTLMVNFNATYTTYDYDYIVVFVASLVCSTSGCKLDLLIYLVLKFESKDLLLVVMLVVS
jgi:hypothetical protein